MHFGIQTDKPVPADYDGDGWADHAIYRDGVWYLLRSTMGFAGISFGAAADKPVVGDYDGDGKSDIAVWRPQSDIFYVLQSGNSNQFSATSFGQDGDITVATSFRQI